MESILMSLLTAILSALFVFFAMALFFHFTVQPYLDGKVEEMRKIADKIEESIHQGVKNGMRDSFKDLPTTTVKETTRSVVKMGSGLVEGGLSAIFGDKTK